MKMDADAREERAHRLGLVHTCLAMVMCRGHRIGAPGGLWRVDSQESRVENQAAKKRSRLVCAACIIRCVARRSGSTLGWVAR